jgi:riboflavin kinase/FMN adenylyltransferase
MLRQQEPGLILTIGTFDGVHLGHRHLVHQVVSRARERGCLSGAITFHPHPRAVVTGHGPSGLCTLDKRLALLRGLGLNTVLALAFTPELAHLPALDFMCLLCEHVPLHELWVGPDFRLGHRREGTVTRLGEIGGGLGYDVHTVPSLAIHGQPVSSTRIRVLVGQGQVEEVGRLLARRHCVGGLALPGGRQDRLGACTVAMVLADDLALPAGGAYAALVWAEGRRWPATIQVEPGPDGAGRRLEVSLPDQAGDLVGQWLQVEFVRRLRPMVPAQWARPPADTVRRQSQPASPA